MDLTIAKENAHYIAVTGIVRRKNPTGHWEYLLCKRSSQEKLFPNKWCVPGGRLQQSDFLSTPKDTNDHWFNVLEKTLVRELKEETAVSVTNIRYVSSLALVRPNGFSTIIISLCADWFDGEVTLQKTELADYQWSTIADAKNVDLIENIYEQLLLVEKMM